MGTPDWLRPPPAHRAGHVLGQTPAEEDGSPAPAPETRSFDLLSPEHRDKLVTMFRWAKEGRRWDDVKDDARTLFGLDGTERPR
jgi:hypothetical protein